MANLLDNHVKVVEVGVFRGQMALNCIPLINKLSEYWLVDQWLDDPNYDQDPGIKKDSWEDVYRQALTVQEQWPHKVRIVKKKSVEAAKDFRDASMDVVFIDADHRYEYVKADIMAWLPVVRAGGFLMGHDYGTRNHWGVEKAVDELLGSYGEGVTVEDDRVWWVCV
jgi:hypothetical protein